MKKTLTIIGGIVAAIVAYGVLLVAYGFLTTGNVDDEAKAYVDATVPKIFSEWTQEQILAEFDDGVKQKVVTPETITKLTDYTKKEFGAYKEYKGSTGQARVHVNYFFQKTVAASYKTMLEFEKGPAMVTVSLLQRGSEWQMIGININHLVEKPVTPEVAPAEQP